MSHNIGILPSIFTDSTGTNSTITSHTGSEEVYLIDNNASAVTITIPAGSTVEAGYKYQIKRLGSGGVTVTPSSGTIETVPSFSLGAQFDSITLISNGSNWLLI